MGESLPLFSLVSKYGYNSQGEIVRTIDILAKKMYNYTYDNGRIEQAAESDITFSTNELIDLGTSYIGSKTLVCSIRYYYDHEGNLVKKCIISADGEQIIT